MGCTTGNRAAVGGQREFARALGACWAGDVGDRAPVALAAILDTTPVWRPVLEAMRNGARAAGSGSSETSLPRHGRSRRVARDRSFSIPLPLGNSRISGRLPDGTSFVPWAGVKPLSARWISALDPHQRALREEWIARRARARERGTLTAELAHRIECWWRAGRLPRGVAVTDEAPEQVLLELACDAAVGASKASSGANREGFPALEDRARSASLLGTAIAGRRAPSRTDVMQLHAQLCPSLRPSPLDGRRSENVQARGRLRRDRGFVLGSDRILKEGCPPDRLEVELDALLRALAPAGGSDEIDPARAAWALYALLMLHPFYDGNGRVARLIASFVMVRDGGMPLFLAPRMHGGYLDAVARAHFGEPETLVRLVDTCQGVVLEDLLQHIT